MHTCKNKAIMNLELKQINHTRRHGVPSFSLLRGVDSDLLLELNLPSEWGKCRSLSTVTFDIWPQLDLRVIEAASCFRIASSQSIGLSNRFLETKSKIFMKTNRGYSKPEHVISEMAIDIHWDGNGYILMEWGKKGEVGGEITFTIRRQALDDLGLREDLKETNIFHKSTQNHSFT